MVVVWEKLIEMPQVVQYYINIHEEKNMDNAGKMCCQKNAIVNLSHSTDSKAGYIPSFLIVSMLSMP